MDIKEREEMERICFNCNQFFLATMDEPTEFGICLNDEEFEPFLEELLEDTNYACCQELIERKKFSGEQEACADFDEVEEIEIDDDSPLGQKLLRLSETGKLDLETLKTALWEEKIKNIDWKTIPVNEDVKQQLRDSDPKEQQAAISNLGAMIVFGNMEAFKELLNFFKELPPPKTIEEVHFKIELLRHLRYSEARNLLVPHLIDELSRTPSNNTTRGWISDIFQFLRGVPLKEIQQPLERMLKDKRFSYKFKQKIKDILDQ